MNSEINFDNYNGFSAFKEVPKEIQSYLWKDGFPFYFKHELKSNSIVICLHGYTASPYETRPIAAECFKRGIDAAAPLLPGHGFKNLKDQKRELATKMKKDNMLQFVREEINFARENYKKVFIYGQSMGGIISLAIAGENIVDGCAVTAPVIKLPFGAGLLSWLFSWCDIYIKKKDPQMFDFNEKELKNIKILKDEYGIYTIENNDSNNFKYFNLSYSFNHSRSAYHLMKLIYYARKNLNKIKYPILVAHSHNDNTINPIVTEWIKSKSKGLVKILWFDKSHHTMPLDIQGKEISIEIANFFENLA